METTSAASSSAPRLRRTLTLWDLIFYGIVLIQPIAPVPLYGVAQKLSDGHFVTIILIALFAMLITAVSYGRMGALYPTAGSAYTYVGRGLNPHLGFLAGWAMILDYLLQPLINTVWISTALHERYLPQIPYIAWAALIAAIMTVLNLAGVKSSARANKVLLAVMSVVVAFFVWLAIRYLWHGQGWAGLLSTEPFYNPKTFNSHKILTATSFAALTYIGFDGVTTLAEDVENPKRNVLLAVVLTCIFAGVCSGFEAYLGARVWPDWRSFPNLETAFMDICSRVGGVFLFNAMGAILIVAAFGSGLTGTLGAARLLFGMGRDGVLAAQVFRILEARQQHADLQHSSYRRDRVYRRGRAQLYRQRLRARRRIAQLWRLPGVHGSQLRLFLAVLDDRQSRLQTEPVARRDPAADWLRLLRAHLVEPEQSGQDCGRHLVRDRPALCWIQDELVPVRAGDDRLQRQLRI